MNRRKSKNNFFLSLAGSFQPFSLAPSSIPSKTKIDRHCLHGMPSTNLRPCDRHRIWALPSSDRIAMSDSCTSKRRTLSTSSPMPLPPALAMALERKSFRPISAHMIIGSRYRLIETPPWHVTVPICSPPSPNLGIASSDPYSTMLDPCISMLDSSLRPTPTSDPFSLGWLSAVRAPPAAFH
ncbi:hypothetical protein COCNU_scaffold005525G000010 [Cocos nucifera]|nr:hypothetical protein [Cocos nucifera]